MKFAVASLVTIPLLLSSIPVSAQDITIDERVGAGVACGDIDATCAVARSMAAKLIAGQSGYVIGAASACGVDSKRLKRVADVVFSQAERMAGGDVSLQELVKTHLELVNNSAQAQSSGKGKTCPAAVRAFNNLERRCVKERLPLCVTLPPPPSTAR